ncbi:MAG: C4-type zinc ribbon domain-containing protein [Candidatus Omnitrophota bacterium]
MTQQKVDIAQQISKLIHLQEIDSVIYKLNAEKQQKPQQIQQLNQQMEAELKLFEDKKGSLRTFQLKHKEKEMDLEHKETEIKKLNTQLYQLKTNKEYEIMQIEINKHKADKSVLEDSILQLFDDIENAELKVNEEKQILEKKQQQISAEIKSIEGQIKAIENELTSQEAIRQQAAAEVDSKILSNYDKILTAKDGLALVKVENDACGGCNMHLPPQVINEIKLKNEIIYCQMCSRILYDTQG